MQAKTLITGITAGILIVTGIVFLLSADTFLAGVFLVSLGMIALAFTIVFASGKRADKTKEKHTAKRHFFSRNKKQVEDLDLDVDDLMILELMKEGNSNQEIAIKTNIPINKVNVSINTIFKKLNVTRRSKAIEKAQELKLIP